MMEDFFSADFAPKEDVRVPFSNVYEVHEGGFGNNEEGIRTFFCSTTVESLEEDVETFEKLTSEKTWPASQIIQREIDFDRIRAIATQYILQDRNIKYFPPIIIALLPKEEKGNKISSSFHDQEVLSSEIKEKIAQKSRFANSENAKRAILASDNKVKLDGLYVLEPIPNLNYKIIAWDKKKYYAIVIDGQHRLESLKHSALVNSEVRSYLQDLVFVDLSERASSQKLKPVEAVRRVFIDINNNAVPVSQARKCLMDDKNAASLFVQALVDDDDPNGDRKAEYIPPQIIDWHSENLKHQLPHLTGVLTLYQLMSDVVLGKKNLEFSITDLRSKKKIRKWIDIMQTRFLVDERIKKLKKYEGIKQLEDSWSDYVERLEESDSDDEDLESILFEFDYKVLQVAQDTFREVYCEGLARFFRDLKIYSRVISILESENVFNKDYKVNRIVITNPRKLSEEELEIFKNVKKTTEDQLNSRYYLAFTVLGQKSFFDVFFRYLLVGCGTQIRKQNILDSANSSLDSLNQMFDILDSNDEYYLFGKSQDQVIPDKIIKQYRNTGYGRQGSSFWEDIIYKDTSIIYNSQGINSFRSVIEYVLNFFDKNLNSDSVVMDAGEDDDFSIAHMESRIKRRLISEAEQEESVAERVTENIKKAKKEFLDGYLWNCVERYKSTK